MTDWTKHADCHIEGCTKPMFCRKYCGMHYKRWWRFGDPSYVRIIKICSINNCNEKHHSKGLCSSHMNKQIYQENRKAILERHKKWRQNNPDYDRKHLEKYPEKRINKMKKHYQKYAKKLNINPYEYKFALLSWGKLIKERDKKECCYCKSTDMLESHHIFEKQFYPKLSLNINNGTTLCHKCHNEVHYKLLN